MGCFWTISEGWLDMRAESSYIEMVLAVSPTKSGSEIPKLPVGEEVRRTMITAQLKQL